MKMTVEIQGQRFFVQSEEAVALSIPLQFNGSQPNHFGTAKAKQEVLRLGGFVGKTELGGSCNVDVLEFIPHCNGTHTETVSHIVNEDIWIGHAANELACLAKLVTVPIRDAANCGEAYRPAFEASDQVITKRDLMIALQRLKDSELGRLDSKAIIIRTLPNDAEKRQRQYATGTQPAFLTADAMQLIDQLGCHHLIVDLPSVDKMYDDGLLTNHHIFWHVPEGTHSLTGETRQERTITEMAFIPDDIEDSVYLLNLQLPCFAGDAAPSRPMIMKLALA
ncbi:MAG: cyclase family protein [Aureliella sp.]